MTYLSTEQNTSQRWQKQSQTLCSLYLGQNESQLVVNFNLYCHLKRETEIAKTPVSICLGKKRLLP